MRSIFRHGSTPSPLSPTPSPAGSIGSIGSNGSNSSNEGNHTQNGRQASTASVTSPVSVSIPQRIHSVMAQHVSSTSKLVNCIDMWDRADSQSSDYQGRILYYQTLVATVVSMKMVLNFCRLSLDSIVLEKFVIGPVASMLFDWQHVSQIEEKYE